MHYRVCGEGGVSHRLLPPLLQHTADVLGGVEVGQVAGGCGCGVGSLHGRGKVKVELKQEMDLDVEEVNAVEYAGEGLVAV